MNLSTSDLVGRYLIRAGEAVWVDGPLTLAVRAGGICYLDDGRQLLQQILKDLQEKNQQMKIRTKQSTESRAFGTSGISPAEQARMPEASGMRLLGTLGKRRKNTSMKKALLLIDLQNDYFPGGLFPLWNTEKTLTAIKDAVCRARVTGIVVVHIQHIANPEAGIAPFFNEGTEGVMIHSEILAAAPDAPVVIKHFADSFFKTELEKVLSEHGVGELLVCGMMTQNCVTHTAISKSAEKYKVSILTDCCTTVSESIHLIALHALSTRASLTSSRDAICSIRS